MLNQLAERASTYGYRVVALQELEGVKAVGGLMLIPKRSINSKDLTPQRSRETDVKVLTVNKPSELRLSNRILRALDVVELDFKVFSEGAARKALSKLVNTRKPVMVNFSEVLDAILSRRDLSGLYALLSLYERGSLTLVLGSGARELREVHHPVVYYSLLQELGLSEAKALSTLTANPLSVLRSAGFNITL
ncbi:MAG: hypothetical protein QXP80_03030 [Zestosphaera sp.]